MSLLAEWTPQYEEAMALKLWQSFAAHDPEIPRLLLNFTPENRERVRAWWNKWLEERETSPC